MTRVENNLEKGLDPLSSGADECAGFAYAQDHNVTQLTITRIRDLVRSLNYVVSVHAAEELEDDRLTILDLESVLLTVQISERQRDRDSRETKNVVRGRTIEDYEAEAVVKFGHAGTLFVITVYLV